MELVALLSSGKGTWGQVSGLAKQGEWDKILLLGDAFAKKLLKSSQDTDDRAWHLPSYPELKDSVKSNIADIKNLGYPRGIAGALTAAEFLRQFANDTKWAHLDIAGTAFVEGSSRMYYGYGATGAGVRILTNYLQNN